MASKLHVKIGELLKKTPPFSGCTLRQEVPVSELFDYPNGREKYDWVIPELKLVIEGMGLQHFKPAAFGGQAEKAIMEFQEQQFRDQKKKEAALLAGWIYICISHQEIDKLKPADLQKLYLQNTNTEPLKPKKSTKIERLKTEKNNQFKQHQKRIYKKLKENQKEARKNALSRSK